MTIYSPLFKKTGFIHRWPFSYAWCMGPGDDSRVPRVFLCGLAIAPVNQNNEQWSNQKIIKNKGKKASKKPFLVIFPLLRRLDSPFPPRSLCSQVLGHFFLGHFFPLAFLDNWTHLFPLVVFSKVSPVHSLCKVQLGYTLCMGRGWYSSATVHALQCLAIAC